MQVPTKLVGVNLSLTGLQEFQLTVLVGAKTFPVLGLMGGIKPTKTVVAERSIQNPYRIRRRPESINCKKSVLLPLVFLKLRGPITSTYHFYLFSFFFSFLQ